MERVEGERLVTDVGVFDLAGLAAAIERERVARGLTWVGLSREVGVAASTIKRFAGASDAEADGVLTLVAWLGVPPEDFIENSSVSAELLPSSRGGVIRVDMDLVGRPGSRTSIQRLATAAQHAGVSVASLTRRSP